MADKKTEQVLQRVQSARLSRDFALATRLLNQALDAEPDNAILWAELGSCYVKAGNDARAVDPYNQVLKIEPRNISALTELGGVYRRLGEFDRSIAVLENAMMVDNSDLQIHYNLGHTYKLAGRYDAAEECFNLVLERNPNDVLAINHIGNIKALQGNHTGALQSYRRALSIDPNHPILHLNMAKSFQALGKEAEAKLSYENALKSKPGWEDAMNGYAELLMRGKDLTKCDSLLDQAIRVNPTSPELHSSKGHLNVKKGKYNAAEDNYTTALDYDNENMNALNGLELLYEKQGRTIDAMKQIKRMEELAPGTLDYELRYSKLLIDQKLLEQAGEKLRGMYKNNLDNSAYLNMLSQYFVRSGHIDKANGCFQRIAQIDPGNINYLRDTAWQYNLNGQYTEARSNLDYYLKRRPDDPYALSMSGTVYENMGEPEKALEEWKKALEYDENNPVILGDVKRLGETAGGDPAVTAILTDILTDSANSGDAASIQKSMAMYESRVQNMQTEDAEVPAPIMDDLAAEIESLETIDYDQLLQFEVEKEVPEDDPYDTLTFDVNPEEVLRPIDEEMYSKKLQNERMDHVLSDDDMPFEYEPTRDGALPYDPFAEGSRQKYDPEEKNSSMDVTGTGFEDELFDDDDNEQTEYRAVGEPMAAKPVPSYSPDPAPYTPTAPREPAPFEPPVPQAELVQPAAYAQPAEPDGIPEEEPFEFPSEDDLFPGDRDTSEDEIPTVDDLISDPLEEDELNELTDVPTISDVIGDDLMPEEDAVISDNDDEPIVDEIPEDVPSEDAQLPEEEQLSEDEPLTEDETLSDENEPIWEDEAVSEAGDEDLQLDDEDLISEENEEPVAEESLETEDEQADEPAADDLLSAEDVVLPETEESLEDEGSLEDMVAVASTHPDPEIRTMETVGNVLKTVFQTEERPVFANAAAMFSDLRDMTQWLPENKMNSFMNSLERLKLDYVIARLNGKRGLLSAASAVRETGGIAPAEPTRKPSLLKTMEYMRSLTASMPDAGQGAALSAQIERITGLMQKKGE